MADFDLISDLHLDMRKNAIQMLMDIEPTSYTLVIAGDLCEAQNLNPEWIRILSEKYDDVIYVPGNHEFYGTTWETTWKILDNAMLINTHLLRNQVEYHPMDTVAYAGSTLWFPNQPDNMWHERNMTDFSIIPGFKEWVYLEHSRSKFFLAGVRSDVWVTHHLPFWRSVHPKYEGDNLNRFFVGDVSDELRASKAPPKVIVHGHTHEPCDYMVGDTRVVCNPLGYPNEGLHNIVPVNVRFDLA